jgi:uncharacterized PurR-regulated membrane protein YhhQ (DUF165 family)
MLAGVCVGQFFDSLLFYPLAFAPRDDLVSIMLSNWIFKVLWQLLASPVLVYVVSRYAKENASEIVEKK